MKRIPVLITLTLVLGLAGCTGSRDELLPKTSPSTIQATLYPSTQPVKIHPGYIASWQGLIPTGSLAVKVCADVTVKGRAFVQFAGDDTKNIVSSDTQVCSERPGTLGYAEYGRIFVLVTSERKASISIKRIIACTTPDC